jgi:hypothetical protein
MEDVEIMGRFPPKQFVVKHVQTRQFVNVPPGLARQIQRFIEQTPTVLNHIPTPSVNGRVNHDVRAGCHEEVGTR